MIVYQDPWLGVTALKSLQIYLAEQRAFPLLHLHSRFTHKQRNIMASDGEITNVGMVLYPGFTALDFVGPFEVLSRMTNTKVYKLWKSKEPVLTDTGLAVLPDTVIGDHPRIDIVFVPGGPGQAGVLDDDVFLDWLAETGARAQYVTSVCSGSLILGAAGLLKGYNAACHWAARQYLSRFGAIVVTDRVVVDRNRITGGGVTAGIDFALTLCLLLRGEKEAQALQLLLEYNPKPPFNAGSPDQASKEVLTFLHEFGKDKKNDQTAAIEKAAARRNFVN